MIQYHGNGIPVDFKAHHQSLVKRRKIPARIEVLNSTFFRSGAETVCVLEVLDHKKKEADGSKGRVEIWTGRARCNLKLDMLEESRGMKIAYERALLNRGETTIQRVFIVPPKFLPRNPLLLEE